MARRSLLDRKLRDYLRGLQPTLGTDKDGEPILGPSACCLCEGSREGHLAAPQLMAFKTGLIPAPLSVPVCKDCRAKLTHTDVRGTFIVPTEVATALLDRVYGEGNAPTVQFQTKGEYKNE